MSLSNQDSQFARVFNGEVLEWPVLYSHILNRKLPLRLFKQISFGVKPPPAAYVHLNEVMKMVGGVPTVSYDQVPFTLEEIVFSINEPRANSEGVNIQQTIATVDPKAIYLISDLTRTEITKRLNNFAKTRWYDSIDTLVTYTNDPDPQHSYEGNRGVELRSLCWINIRIYETAVMTGVKSLPKTVDEIYANIPVLTWGDESNNS